MLRRTRTTPTPDGGGDRPVVRLRLVVPLLVLLGATYVLVVHPWMLDRGSTAAERQLALPGDDLYGPDARPTTQAVTIHAPAERVWPWLVQVGQDKGGFYAYTWLENVFGLDIHNADRIHPEWQQLSAGDSWRLAPPGYLGGVGEGAVTPVRQVESGRALVLDTWGAFVLEPVDAQTTRLLLRGHVVPAGPTWTVVQTLVWDPVVETMNRRMLLGVAARAEGRADPAPVPTAVADLGFVAGAAAVVALLLPRRRHRWWLVVPLASALPALALAHDVRAGLTAFVAVGVVVAGFCRLGRRWWGPLLLVAAAVLLALLLAPDAYVVIGLALAASVLLAASRLGRRRLRVRTGVGSGTREERAPRGGPPRTEDARGVRRP